MTLSIHNLCVTRGKFTLQLDFETTSRALAVFGPSAAGKTTLVEVLSGILLPHEGSIRYAGRVLSDAGQSIHIPIDHRRIGYVPQDLALFPHMTAGQNIEYAADGKSDLTEILKVLQIINLKNRKVSHLSGGEKQRVALARALAAKPELLLLDEPLANLDQQLKDTTMQYLRGVIELTRVPIVYVSHSADEVVQMCDYAIFLDSGALVAQGAVENLFVQDAGPHYIPRI